MEKLKKIHDTFSQIAKDTTVNISKIDDYTFNVIIDGELMDSFEKLGKIQNRIEKSCSDGYTLQTIYGEGQEAKLIIKKN